MAECMDIIEQRLKEINDKIEDIRPVVETYFFKRGVDWLRLSEQGVVTDHLEELHELVAEKNILSKLQARGPRSSAKGDENRST